METRGETRPDARSVLRDDFGFEAFRAGQARAVEAFLADRDVAVLLPTGGGKSLCFQVPARVRQLRGQGPTVVVSPLIALMEDQVRQLDARGIPAVGFHSGMTGAQLADARARAAGAALIYCSPERLARKSSRDRLGRLGVSAVAIDEAHCISEWGHDFRKDYRKLGVLKAEWGVPVMAVTATATPRVADDLEASLGLRDPVRIGGRFVRDNLRFSVEHRYGDKDRVERVAHWLDHLGLGGAHSDGRAVVYAGTRKRTVAVAKALKERGYRVGHYHAGRTDGARSRAQERFAGGEIKVLVATTAFGMGIDLPDIRLVAHVQCPPTLEAYVQQAGRAGRDGTPAHAVLLWSAGDVRTRARVVRQPTPGERAGWKALQDYCFATTCRQSAISAWFTGFASDPCGTCDACTDPAAVDESVRFTRELLADRRAERRRTREDEDALQLEPEQLDRVVDFVEGLRKPVGKRLVALGLRGSRAKPVKRAKLTEHPLHGALAGVPERVLVRAVEELLEAGRLARRGKKYPTVWIPDKRVRPKRDPDAPPRRAPRYTGLEGALRDFRRREARRRRTRPYVVFDNTTLSALLEARPANRASLAEIRGMGPKRVERYGTLILDLIREHT